MAKPHEPIPGRAWPGRAVAVLLLALLAAALGVIAYTSASLTVRVLLAAARLETTRDVVRLIVANRNGIYLGMGLAAAVVLWNVYEGWLQAAFGGSSRRFWRKVRLGVVGAAAVLALVLLALLVWLPERLPGGRNLLVLARHAELAVPTFPAHLETVECRADSCGDVRTNRWGLRGPEVEPTPRPGTLRVLLVGDSYVFGSGVLSQGTLARQLEKQLEERCNRPVEVVNGGIPGFNFAATSRMGRRLVSFFRPQVVVAGFLRGNDLEPESPWERLEDYGERLYRMAAVLGADRDLFTLEMERHARGTDGYRPAAEDIDRFRRDLADLAATCRNQGAHLVLLSYFGAIPELLDGVAPLPVVYAPRAGWQQKPGLAIPGDGHPTAQANGLFARELAPRICEPPQAFPSR